MTDFNYKKYSLENLENWLHDAMSAGEATPEEIYSTIKKVVEEQYYHHKHYTGQAYELLALLNGNGKDFYTDTKGNEVPVDSMTPWGHSDIEYAIREAEYYNKSDKVVKWQLPVEVDGLSGECYINLPDDLLEAANLKEGDTVEWVDNDNGSYTMRKVNGTK
jgi:hypothetical protein